jgi:hypothetical protein
MGQPDDLSHQLLAATARQEARQQTDPKPVVERLAEARSDDGAIAVEDAQQFLAAMDLLSRSHRSLPDPALGGRSDLSGRQHAMSRLLSGELLGEPDQSLVAFR